MTRRSGWYRHDRGPGSLLAAGRLAGRSNCPGRRCRPPAPGFVIWDDRPQPLDQVPAQGLGEAERSTRGDDRMNISAIQNRKSGRTFPPNPPKIHSWSVSPCCLNTPTRDLSVEELTGRPRRSMSLIEKSEMFPAKQSCENADNITIPTIFPTVQKT